MRGEDCAEEGVGDACDHITLMANREVAAVKLTRGENMDEDEAFSQGNGEACDEISRLDRSIAVKIFSYVDIADLARCACVCRSWKVIMQASSLWSRLDFYKVKHRVTDKVTTKLMAKCRPYLIHLNLRACPLISEPTFTTISECRNLQDVNFSECKGLNDETLKTVVKGCKILLYLNVSHTGITDSGLRTISKYCQNVQYLSIAFCKRFSDRGLSYLATGKNNKKLEYVDMSGCLQITPLGFKNFANGCVNVQQLYLNEFPTLNDECMLGLSALGNNIRLRDVTLSECTSITDLGLQKFTQQCKELERLDLSHCMLITDGAIKNLAFCCRNLNVLNLAGCKLLTDSSVQYLSGVCHYLTWLDLSGCYLVTNKALSYLKKGCKKMNTLIIKYCKGIQKPAAQKIMKHIRNVEYNNDEVPYYFGYY
ncbi:hypothetical protein KUTeg_020163 [Tegillarca granosa]|uniref:F-box domain-containing protein n=1 Tax=Tegillarca granosa TaxID=220873 RepID=A0ABQ9E703_TEGGR|nr:hypothetical protein KUTeg_020163 [Tegillarca granosa]